MFVRCGGRAAGARRARAISPLALHFWATRLRLINQRTTSRPAPAWHPLRVQTRVSSEYAFTPTDFLQICRGVRVASVLGVHYPFRLGTVVAFGHERRTMHDFWRPLQPLSHFSVNIKYATHTRIYRLSTVLEDATWNSSDNNTSMLSSLMPSTRPARLEFELPETRTRGAFRASFGLGLHNPLTTP